MAFKYLSYLFVISALVGNPLAGALAATGPIDSPEANMPSAVVVSDATITAKVKAALAANNLSGIEVSTELGIVKLSGTLASEEMRQRATLIAAKIDGVRGVDYASLSIKNPL
jgi:osmotically-inducible protein OsmY